MAHPYAKFSQNKVGHDRAKAMVHRDMGGSIPKREPGPIEKAGVSTYKRELGRNSETGKFGVNPYLYPGSGPSSIKEKLSNFRPDAPNLARGGKVKKPSINVNIINPPFPGRKFRSSTTESRLGCRSPASSHASAGGRPTSWTGWPADEARRPDQDNRRRRGWTWAAAKGPQRKGGPWRKVTTRAGSEQSCLKLSILALSHYPVGMRLISPLIVRAWVTSRG
jgi:hypothetical protein